MRDIQESIKARRHPFTNDDYEWKSSASANPLDFLGRQFESC